MNEAESKKVAGYPASIRRIVVVRSDGTTARLKPIAPQDVDGAPRVSKKYRKAEREMRAFTNAAQAFFGNYKSRHERSTGKKENGAFKDFFKNSHKSSVQATKVLRNESRLYRKSKMARKLHEKICKLQDKALS